MELYDTEKISIAVATVLFYVEIEFQKALFNSVNSFGNWYYSLSKKVLWIIPATIAPAIGAIQNSHN